MFTKHLSGLSPRGLAVVMFVLVFGGACGSIGVFFAQTQKLGLRAVHEHVADLARVAVAALDLDLHERLTSPDQFESDDYRRALAPLAQFHQRQPSIDFVFTIRETAGKEFFILDTEADPTVHQQQLTRGRKPTIVRLLEPYQAPANSATARPTLEAGKIFVFPEPYADEYGKFVEARAPLFDRAGRYVGYLGIDYDLDLLNTRIAQIRRAALVALGLALAVGLLLARLAYDTRGKLIATMAALQRAEATALEQRDLATKASAAKSDLLAIASHDLKNPLSAIGGMAGLMLQEKRALPDSPVVREDIETLESIQASAQHMFGIVRGILMSEGLEQGGLPFSAAPVDLSALGAKIIQFNAGAAKRKHIAIQNEISPGLVLTADAKLLHEAFDNYLSNAIKYSSSGQSVVVRAVPVTGEPAIEFSVRDAGPGLSADDQAKLFRKFQKLTARPTGGESSTGLGLSIVKTIAELHHGRVGCESQLGSGARFWIRLPLAPPAPASR